MGVFSRGLKPNLFFYPSSADLYLLPFIRSTVVAIFLTFVNHSFFQNILIDPVQLPE